MSLELEHEFQALSGLLIDEGYGMTEVGLATLNPPRGPIKQGSIGRPVGGFAICVRDDERCECGNGTVGRVWIRTPSQTIGYWDNPEATAEILRDGWLDSGDLARADDDGYLWFFGRKKQIIVHDGSNISPGEVEEALAEHPAVALVGVVGIHDEVHGENVRAYVTDQERRRAADEPRAGRVRTRADRVQGAGGGGVPRRDAREPHRQARPGRAEGARRGPPPPARAPRLSGTRLIATHPPSRRRSSLVTITLGNVTIDCDDPQKVASFWSAALGRPVDDGASEFFVSIGREDSSQTGWFFIKVPEPKQVKNRAHFDLHTDDREAEVERLLGLGATRVGDYDEHGAVWTTLRDVEGNEFCVA